MFEERALEGVTRPASPEPPLAAEGADKSQHNQNEEQNERTTRDHGKKNAWNHLDSQTVAGER